MTYSRTIDTTYDPVTGTFKRQRNDLMIATLLIALLFATGMVIWLTSSLIEAQDDLQLARLSARLEVAQAHAVCASFTN